ncbi:isoflavone reductase-like isoform X2 [Glycine max]|uniref:isoflavone reductase-like isoform X2 n=1 Tax=Glycine max TaxID=3847 RepID=UPI00071933A7|nr:isoflavone reductase-like isoform X2 [Glycine max]|eukprot:XP_025983107.1 isoflavone reductase isoform X2 [Glycine max]
MDGLSDNMTMPINLKAKVVVAAHDKDINSVVVAPNDSLVCSGSQIDITVPPRDKVFILGDGNVKGAFVTEADVGTLTIEAANEPNALNKTVRIRLPKNYLTINEIISLWENKIGKTLEKTYVSEEKVLKDIKGKARFRG